jgi:hypothetical protein
VSNVVEPSQLVDEKVIEPRAPRRLLRSGGRRKATPALVPTRPGPRGWLGRGRGEDVLVDAPDEYRGTTVQVCGLWPWVVGSGTPMVGVPFARHLATGATVCCDPISWFQRAALISNPSLFALAIPGVGKTSAIMRMAVGLSGYGVIPLVLGDTRPDYTDMIRALGGQVIRLGRNRGSLNVLDPGEAPDAAARLRAAGFEKEAEEVLADVHGLRLNMLSSLITVLRKSPPTLREETILARALTWLDESFDGIPVIPDLLDVVRAAPPELREAALDRGVDTRYREVTEDLEAALLALLPGGKYGNVFARQTTEPMRRDRAVVFDVSAIPQSEGDLRAVALLASWTAGFAVVNIAQTLADAGLEPRRHYFAILDELHQALKAGPGLVDRVDYLTRLNRTVGVGLAMITHTLKDLLSLPLEEDRQKAMGFIERSGMVLCGGLPLAELGDGRGQLGSVVNLSQAERDLLAGWQDPPAWDPKAGRESDPPGRGKFLIKVGGRPGIPVDVTLTAAEKALSMGSRRWRDQSRVGLLDEANGPG